MVKDKDKTDKGGGDTPSHGGVSPHLNPTYTRWLLEAVRKIKSQKQRPCLERISVAVKNSHGDIGIDTIKEQLELAVEAGKILCVCNKGVYSYRDPARLSRVGNPTRTLTVNRKSDLTKIIIRSIGDLNDREGGSSLKNIEKYIRRSYQLELDDNVDLTHQLRISAKRAVNSNRLHHEGRIYKVPNSTCANSVSDQTTPPRPPAESHKAKVDSKPEPEVEEVVDMAAKKALNKVGMKKVNRSTIVLSCLKHVQWSF